MPQKNIRHLWRETLSSRPASRDAFKSMHLAVLPQATRQNTSEQLATIRFEIGDFLLCESKGHPPYPTLFELPCTAAETLWICFQFHGTVTFANGIASQADTLFAFAANGKQQPLTLPDGKQWALYLGVSGASRQQLLSELPLLRKQLEQGELLPGVSISYLERQALESLPKRSFGSFSTLYHIGQLILSTYSNYTEQLRRHLSQPQEHPHILLYNQAIAYIRENYMDEALGRETIAEALHCSPRSLYRAFEGRPASLNASILILRLYKSRELLRDQPELSVERIALMLHFPNAKHFAFQYKKYFHQTPRQERKVINGRKPR